MGKRSFRRSNSILSFAVLFILVSAFLARLLYFLFQNDVAEFTRFVTLGFAWIWICFWVGAALLFHERRTYYRMIERQTKKEDSY